MVPRSSRKASFIALIVWRMGNKERKKKKSKEKYELERRQLELEEQLLDIQQRRLDLEQKRVELQLKKVRLATRKPKRQSAPPIVIGESSGYVRSDDENSFLTAPTVSTQNEYSDNSADRETVPRAPSQRFSGGESDGESAVCPPKADPRCRFTETKRSTSGGDASEAKSEPIATTMTPPALRRRSSSEVGISENDHDDKGHASATKRAVQSMRNLVTQKPPSRRNEPERSASLRDLLTETHADAFALLQDSCSRSAETIDSSKTKKASNVSEHKKTFDRGRSYPSFNEDPASRHNSNHNLNTGDLQNGEYVYEWADGRRYEGSWKDGKFHGLGVHTWPNGGKYVGQYKDGLKWGYGVYDWKDGSKYEGQFANGKRNGQGAQLNANGTIYHNGLWKDDEPIR